MSLLQHVDTIFGLNIFFRIIEKYHSKKEKYVINLDAAIMTKMHEFSESRSRMIGAGEYLQEKCAFHIQ